MEANSTRFINAFVSIEMHLKEILNTGYLPFNQLVYRASKIDKVVRHYQLDLNEFAQLRNAIMHTRAGQDRIIAEPHDEIVEEIETILKHLTRAPKTLDFFKKEVYCADIKDDFRQVIAVKKDKHYSVMPVYDGKRYLGIIHDALYRRAVENEIPIDSFEDLLKLQEKKDRVVFMDKDCALVDVLSAFNEVQAKGTRIIAIIITNKGHMNEFPLSILTLKDLPKVMSNLKYSS